jgi:hypothetical protein
MFEGRRTGTGGGGLDFDVRILDDHRIGKRGRFGFALLAVLNGAGREQETGQE